MITNKRNIRFRVKLLKKYVLKRSLDTNKLNRIRRFGEIRLDRRIITSSVVSKLFNSTKFRKCILRKEKIRTLTKTLDDRFLFIATLYKTFRLELGTFALILIN